MLERNTKIKKFKQVVFMCLINFYFRYFSVKLARMMLHVNKFHLQAI